MYIYKSDTGNIDGLLEELNKEVITSLDNCAPEIEKSISTHIRNSCYPSEIR